MTGIKAACGVRTVKNDTPVGRVTTTEMSVEGERGVYRSYDVLTRRWGELEDDARACLAAYVDHMATRVQIEHPGMVRTQAVGLSYTLMETALETAEIPDEKMNVPYVDGGA